MIAESSQQNEAHIYGGMCNMAKCLQQNATDRGPKHKTRLKAEFHNIHTRIFREYT
jgi:hypothetical protein